MKNQELINMNTIELIYNFTVLSMATLIFLFKITVQNNFFEVILKILFKLVPLFIMIYTIIQIFKHYKII